MPRQFRPPVLEARVAFGGVLAAVRQGGILFENLRTQNLGHPSPHTEFEALMEAGYTADINDGFTELDEHESFYVHIGLASLGPSERWLLSRKAMDGSNSALYHLWFQPKAGLIEVHLCYEDISPDRDKVWRSADIIALAWYRAAEDWFISTDDDDAEEPDLKHFVASGVDDHATKEILAAIGQLPRWPGKIFESSTNEGKALLSTPTGSLLVQMIKSHPVMFPWRTVTKVQVYANSRNLPDLIFSIDALDEEAS